MRWEQSSEAGCRIRRRTFRAGFTDLAPRELLEACLRIERAAGRTRGARWDPRTLDLDIVRFGDRELVEPGLHIPHPALPHRDFWRRELEELLPHVR